MSRVWRILALVLGTLPAFAATEILFQSGFRMTALRHEVVGDSVRLHTSSGTVEFPRAQVASIEELPDAPSPAAEPPAATTVPTPPATPERPKTPQQQLAEAAGENGLPAEFLLSVAKVESAFQEKALSPKGAIGVMQLMPETAKALQVNPHDTAQNISGGAKLLRDLLLKYENYPDQVYRALSAYNAGPGAVAKYNGIPPYAETRQYVEKVLNEFHRLKTISKSPRGASKQ